MEKSLKKFGWVSVFSFSFKTHVFHCRLPESSFVRFWASLDPALLSAVLVGLAAFLGVLAGVYAVHKIPRKLLMLMSSAGTAMSFWVLGGYYLLVEYGTYENNVSPPVKNIACSIVYFSYLDNNFSHVLSIMPTP